MTDETVLAQEAGPEVVTEPQENQTEGQEAESPEGEQPDPQKSAAKERRERDQKLKRELWEQRNQAEERAQKALAEAERLKQVLQGKQAPKEADFPDPIEFAAVKAAFLSRADMTQEQIAETEAAAKAAREEAQRFQSQEYELIEQAWEAQKADAQSRYADFAAVALNPNAPIAQHVADLIKTSEAGADLAYHLGKNPDIARQISALPPIEAARVLGRMEAQLSAPPAKPTTNAPPPINPVRGSTPGGKTPDSMSYAEFKAWREKGGKL